MFKNWQQENTFYFISSYDTYTTGILVSGISLENEDTSITP